MSATATDEPTIDVADLTVSVWSSDCGSVIRDNYDLVNIQIAMVDLEDGDAETIADPEAGRGGETGNTTMAHPAYHQHVIDLLAACLEGSPPGDYLHHASEKFLRDALANLTRAVEQL